MRVYITGSSGVITSALIGHLVSKGHSLYCHKQEGDNEEEEAVWTDKGVERFIGESPLDAVIHPGDDLPLSRRWENSYESNYFENLIRKTRRLAEYLVGLKKKPKVFVLISNVGYYGDRGDSIIDETCCVGEGRHAEMCRQLEIASLPARQAGIRVVQLRPGVIISPHLPAFLQPFLSCQTLFTGVWGDGKQYLSWISIEDAVHAIEFILNRENMTGPVNLTTTAPLINREFTETLALPASSSTLRAIPAWLVRLLFGEISSSILLSSHRALPKKLMASGYVFQHPTLEETIPSLGSLRK